VTAAQCLEARRLLRWSRERLSARTGLAATTLQVFEHTGRMPQSKWERADRLGMMRRVFERAGVEFTNGDEPGVRLRKPKP